MEDLPVARIADVTAAVEQAYARLRQSVGRAPRTHAAAELILAIFDEFYVELCEYPYRAQRAFEAMAPQASLRISKERLGLYSRYVAHHGPRIKALFPELSGDQELWDDIDRLLLERIENRYEADIAFSFAHSIRRNIWHGIWHGIWQPVAYSFSPPHKGRPKSLSAAHRRFRLEHGVDAELMLEVLQLPGLSAPFRDAAGDAARIAERVNALIARGELGERHPVALDVVKAGFFRDLTAFLVGRFVDPDGGYHPFAIGLLNSESGIYADAVLHRSSDLHNLFSSTLANFHVTSELYYQICAFLYSVMPSRPLGLHYSTIGFNHVGKVAILDDIKDQMARSGQVFQHSPGFEGTVAIGFTFDACSYHLKVIRDRPTDSYKWGEFPGADAVVDKYRIVHDINRTGSMLDNVMYFNMELDRKMFDPGLLEEMCELASGNVHVDGDSVLFKSLIVQTRIVPLPQFLETASEDDMEEVMINLGHCIRNNMAANIFNKDLDSRNYGVGYYQKVFLFDYDAVERLTDIKVRTNLDRESGEEDPPAWFFEDGVVFLPEEIEVGLRIRQRFARRCFREHNADLLTPDYWWNVQRRLERGEVLGLRVYPESRKL